MRRNPLLLALLFPFLFALALPLLPAVLAGSPVFAADARAAADPPLEEKARMLMDYQAFMRGDRDGAVRFSLSASRDLQGTPLADLAARLALWYEPAGLSRIDVGEAEARRILSAGEELSPEYRDCLRRFAARAFATAGRREDAMEIHRRRGLAMSWLIAGAFAGRHGGAFESREIPEAGPLEEPDGAAFPPDAGQFKSWRETPPWRPLNPNRAFPFVRPWQGGGRGVDGPVLMAAVLSMTETDNKSAFHIYAEASWRLYVDGALVAEVDKTRREEPVEHMVALPLDAGRREVMLHVFPPPAGTNLEEVRVALRLESETSFEWTRPAAAPKPFSPVMSRREATPLRHLDELRRQMGESPTLIAAYALACLEQHMFDAAAWWAAEAARLDPADPKLLYLAGATAAGNYMLPDERREDAAAGWHRRAVAAKPDLVPSLLYLARLAAVGGDPRAARDYLDRAYAVNPASLDVLLELGSWARTFASGATAQAAWDECGRSFPASPGAQMAIASMPRGGFLDMDRRLAACRAALEAGPYLPGASLMLAEALADSGSPEEADSVLRRALELFDGDAGVMQSVAEIYARMAMYEPAIEAMGAAARVRPDNPGPWRRLGDFWMESGREDGARRFWAASLAADPGQFELADMMAFLRDEPAAGLGAGGYDAIAMTAGAAGEEAASDVVRLLDRSVIMIEEDGAYRHLTHEIDLARTRAGGESLADIRPRGELLTARIVFPNGNTLEPEPYPGQGGLRLPVVIPGAAREVRMLESFPAGTAIRPWFFQDPEGRMPLLISEYVVRAPKGFPLARVLRDFGREIDFDFRQDGDEDVYRWTARLGMPGREPESVHVSERVPSVEIGVKAGWEDVVFREGRSLDGRLTPSMGMLALLAELIGPPGGYPDPERAARSIYRYVCDNIDPTPGRRTAAHIHSDGMGDRGILLLALLRSAGLDAVMAAARPAAARLHPPAWDFPERETFTVPVVRLALPGGQTFWLDTRFDALPFGQIADDLSGATLLAFMPGGPLFETLPELPAGDSARREERTVRLPAAGAAGAEVTGESVRRGVAGLARAQALADADEAARRGMAAAALQPVFPDAELKRFDILRPDDDDPSSRERYEISSRFVVEERPGGVRAAMLCLPPPRVIADETRNLARRRTDCHIRSVRMAEDRNVFVLPEGARFTALPQAAAIPSRFGVYQLRVAARGGNEVEIQRGYHIPPQRIPPWDWPEFLAFLEKIDLAEKQWIEYRAE